MILHSCSSHTLQSLYFPKILLLLLHFIVSRLLDGNGKEFYELKNLSQPYNSLLQDTLEHCLA